MDLQVETQGSAGLTMLDPAVIAAADAVIFAVDVDVRGRERFAGKPVIQVPVKRGIDEPAKLIHDALAAAKNPNARRAPTTSALSAVKGVKPLSDIVGWGIPSTYRRSRPLFLSYMAIRCTH